jgi:hypothetical protein
VTSRDGISKRRQHRCARTALAAALLVSGPLGLECALRAETIYAATGSFETSSRLLRFDSESPEQLDLDVPLVELDGSFSFVNTLDFDPSTGALVAGVLTCSNVPPEPCAVGFLTLDPGAGQFTSFLGSTGQITVGGEASEADLHPATGDLRLALGLLNARVELPTGELVLETELTQPGRVLAIAHGPNSPGASNATTYALWRANAQAPGELVTLGGPGGVPPASSGIVTPIAPLGRNLEPYLGFDISPLGRAYFSQAPVGAPDAGAHLYTIDLSTGATTDLGAIGGGGRDVTALAVAVRGQPAQAIPALGTWALGLLAALLGLCGVAGLNRR